MNAIKKYLNETGMTQTEFCKTVGVGQGMVWQWITEKRPVPIERALDIEERLGIHAEQLNPTINELTERLLRRKKQRKARKAKNDKSA
jgi:transcriptional regulator with XRE-family HTH domain